MFSLQEALSLDCGNVVRQGVVHISVVIPPPHPRAEYQKPTKFGGSPRTVDLLVVCYELINWVVSQNREDGVGHTLLKIRKQGTKRHQHRCVMVVFQKLENSKWLEMC